MHQWSACRHQPPGCPTTCALGLGLAKSCLASATPPRVTACTTPRQKGCRALAGRATAQAPASTDVNAAASPANASDLLSIYSGALNASSNLTALLLDDLVAYLAGGTSALGRRRLAFLPTPDLDTRIAWDATQQLASWGTKWAIGVGDAIEEGAWEVWETTKDAAGAVYDATSKAVYDAAVEVKLVAMGLKDEVLEASKALLADMWAYVQENLERIANNFKELEQAGLLKREMMCAEWGRTNGAYYAGTLNLTSCINGKATLSGAGLEEGPFSLTCRAEGEDKPSAGAGYESSCVQYAKGGGVYWGDGPSAPYKLVYLAGMFLGSVAERGAALSTLLPLGMSGQDRT